MVKVEPPEGESTRWMRPFVGSEPGEERGIPFLSLNVNKRSVALDLGEEDGQAALRGACAGGGHPGGRRLGVRAGRAGAGIRRAEPREPGAGVRDDNAVRAEWSVQRLPFGRADSAGGRRADVRLRRSRRAARDGAVFARASARGAARGVRGAGGDPAPDGYGARAAHRGVRPGGAGQHPGLLRAVRVGRADQPQAGGQSHHRADEHVPHQRRVHLHAADVSAARGRAVRVAGQSHPGGRPVEGRGVPAAERGRAERHHLGVQPGLSPRWGSRRRRSGVTFRRRR